MRDANPTGELSFWLKVAIVVNAMPQEDSAVVTRELVNLSVNPEHETPKSIRAAWDEIDENAFYGALDEARAEAGIEED